MINNKLVLAYIGNGKSSNRYHIPFVLQRKDKFVIKTVFNPHIHHDIWMKVEGINYTENVDEIFYDLDIDLVVVNTQPNFHYEYVKKALESGKHCLCEKPFMPTRAQSQEIFEFAKEKGCGYAILVSSGFREGAHRFYEAMGYTEDVRGFRKYYSAE